DDPADLALAQRRDRERDREVRLAGPRRADAERDRAFSDRVDVLLLRHRLRRDLLATVRPEHVLEDLADVLGLVDRAEHGVDGSRADLLAALDELDELLDDRPRRDDLLILAVERQAVAAQVDRAAQPLAQRAQHAVANPRKL